MTHRYWDLNDFLAEDEFVSATANQTYYNLAILDNSVKKNVKDLEEGKKFDVPLWLAIRLGTEYLTIEVPTTYREKFKKILMADPTVVNLKDKSFYYYEVGYKLCKHIDDKELIPLLARVFLKRMQVIQRKSFCLGSEDVMGFIKKLTQIEREIFEGGRYSVSTYKIWKDAVTSASIHSTASRLRKKLKKT